MLFFAYKYHDPCHDQNHYGTDGGSQIGLYSLDSYFSKDGSQTGKYRTAKCIDQPCMLCPFSEFSVFLCFLLKQLFPARGFFLLDHQKSTHCDQNHGNHFDSIQLFTKKNKSQKHGQYCAWFIHRYYFIDISDLQGPEITEPWGTCGQSWKYQE